jgi:ribonuclease-3
VKTAGNWSRKYLAYEFSQPALLDRALTHRSKSATNNERLEFLGDAVLGLVIAAALHETQPDADEGDLSRLRASLVRKETLVEIAAEVSLGDAIQLGSGELRSGGHHRDSILADGLEAILGAIYLDSGLDQTRQLILRLYKRRLDNLPATETLKDPKTRLQEGLQSESHTVPVYEVENETGPAHDRHFKVSCKLEKLDIHTTGTGSSRRKAEQAAAADALTIFNDRKNSTS